jgi:3-deoxy-manno-octulosonate cytidylyltransferase (CMP-KDO synthetase)
MVNRILAVIPARWASSRFPGKPLAKIAGKPMIQWVYERTSKAKTVDQVVVATDDERIASTVAAFGGLVEMTPSELPSGTDRVAFVARKYDGDIIVNVQGDEPLIEPDAVDLTAQTLLSDDSAHMATLARRMTNGADIENPNKARIVLDQRQRALYFSRAAVPFARDIHEKSQWPEVYPYYEHIGIYAYRREFLFQFTALPPALLEQTEKLEQLRALENGFVIKVGIGSFDSVCVDVPQDVKAVEQRMKELNLYEC